MQDIRSWCYACDQEVSALQLHNLELQCPGCNSCCLERLGPLEPPVAASVQVAAPLPQRLAPSWLLPAGTPVRSLRPRRHQGPIGEEQVDTGARHVGVICDGCQSRDFTGIRYRCLRCRDFDLCHACHAQRGVIHPSHPFEAIRNPRILPTSAIADIMNAMAPRTVMAIVELGEEMEVRSGLEDSTIAWWLADDRRLVSVDMVAKEEPGWTCPICADGLQAEKESGWVVQICTGQEIDTLEDVTGNEAVGKLGGHIYHEACLRRWLQKRNSCPVCRRAPVIPPSQAQPEQATSGQMIGVQQ
mmetsp:Transcript_38978/g.70355  ORF Transcript_38978/g.70355 Transcript_38978/m.70355 type:complete len:301 (+) Transcript_38978:92-994(+)